MDVQDGFIVGIFNYCDRWCERCAFTSRCRVFADIAEHEAVCDPGLKAVVDAPPLPEEIPPPPPRWMQEMIDEMNEAVREAVSDNSLIEDVDPTLPPDHERISARAHDYCVRVHAWLRSCDFASGQPPSDPRAVIAWFHTSILVKIQRALSGLARDDPRKRDWPADHDGSAKVALLGIEQSHVAWLQLLERGLARDGDVQPMVADLVWLGEELERVFPRARAFVRPAFDEPQEVARLLGAEGGR